MIVYQYLFKDYLSFDVITVQAPTLAEAEQKAYEAYLWYQGGDELALTYDEFVERLREHQSYFEEAELSIYENHFEI